MNDEKVDLYALPPEAIQELATIAATLDGFRNAGRRV